MNEQSWQMAWMGVVTLLPIIPAFVFFKFLPSVGEATGPLHGLTLKLGGSFAGYFILFLCLLYAKPEDAHHFHTWTIRGFVTAEPAADDVEPNLNDLYVRFVPPRLTVLNQGAIEWDVPVFEDANGQLSWPSLQLDLRGYRGLTIPLGPTSSYGGTTPEMTRDEKTRSIVLKNPIKLISVKTGKAYTLTAPLGVTP